MIAKLLLVTGSILLILSGIAEAHHILVVQGSRVRPFEEAMRGFARACPHETFKIVVSESKGNEISEYLREEQPRLIVAVGADALEQVKQVRDVPIVYLMVLNPSQIAPEAKNITGVGMKPPLSQQLDLIRKALPSATKIGVLYDPTRLAPFVKRAIEASRPLGLELVTREVRSPREVPGALQRLRGDIDALWMLPDPCVVTPETTEFILLFSGENRVPVITFSRKYVEMGALLALDIDPYDLGRQAGEMACRIIQGADVRTIPRADARKVVIRVNQSVARRLGYPGDLAERLNAVVPSEP
jgi:putative ABC transport system substrate-binding protein